MNRRNFIVAAIATGTCLVVGLKKAVANSLALEPKLVIAPEEVSVIKRGMPEASDADFYDPYIQRTNEFIKENGHKYPLAFKDCYPPEWTKQYELIRTRSMHRDNYQQLDWRVRKVTPKLKKALDDARTKAYRETNWMKY